MLIKPFMEKHQKPNSKAWVDGWSGYAACEDWMACEYEMVNHTDNYRDPKTGVHNNWAEGEWRELRRFLMQFNGIKSEEIQSYLNEYMIRRDYCPDPRQMFWMLIRELQLKKSTTSTNFDDSH